MTSRLRGSRKNISQIKNKKYKPKHLYVLVFYIFKEEIYEKKKL